MVTRRYCCQSHRQAAYIFRLGPVKYAAQLARKAAARIKARDNKRRF